MSAGHVIPLQAERLFQIGPIPITNSMIVAWFITLFIIAVVLAVQRRIRLVPSGLQNFVEWIIESLYGLAEMVVGKEMAPKIFPVAATIFIFVLLSNWVGLLPGVGTIGFWETEHGGHVLKPLLRGPSTDLNMTLSLAIIAVFVTNYIALRTHGAAGYAGHFFAPHVTGLLIANIAIGLFVGPLEIISELVKFVSFSFRLYGNMFAGENLIMTLTGIMKWGLPVMSYLFETFIGLVQAGVFMMLTLAFTAVLAAKPDEAH